MSPLDAIIRREIEAAGPMPVSQYMQLCLAHPRHGYYTTRDPLGADGDFTTAPEISQLFGEMVAVWLASTWQQMGSPTPLALIELGPGRGTLMADILRATKNVSGFHKALSVHLVETSPALRAKQSDSLKHTGFAPTHHEDLENLPESTSLFVANEFFDALPTNQWVHTDQGWNARKIGLGGTDPGKTDQLIFGVDLTPLPAPKQVPDSAQNGTIIEHSPAQDRMLAQIIDHAQRLGGAGLIIDYGSDITGHGDTLQAVRNHQPVSPLETPGQADLTTHVDFAHLERIAKEAGVGRASTVEQGHFLLELGLLERAGALGASANADMRETISLAVERLAGDVGMGKLFKVLGFCSQPVCLPGFAKSAPNRPDFTD